MAVILRKRVAVAASLLVSAVIAASDPNTALRNDFKQAYAAALVDDSAPEVSARADSAALQSYVLYPYLQAARFKHALALATRDVATLDASIKNWLTQQGSAPVASELRRAWLIDLAMRQQWSEFQAQLPATSNDAELRCLNITAVLNAEPAAEQRSALANTLTSLWLNANRLPAACNVPFEWARNNQIIGPALIEQRVRLTLKSGNTMLARELMALLPAAQAEPLSQWAQLIDKPQVAIDSVITRPRQPVEAAALQDGWFRLARKDVDAALVRWPKLLKSRSLDKAEASPYALSLALALAWSRRSEALSYFARVAPSDMTEQAYEWQVRAALWKGDWRGVEQGIAAMPESLRTQARWRYWLARAKQTTDARAATSLYQALVSGDDNYYAAMAAARLTISYVPHAMALPSDADAMQTLTRSAGFKRAHELFVVQLRDAALLEWSQAFAALQPGEHLAAARLAHEWGWYDQAIAVTAKLGLYNDYLFLYPQPYQAEVARGVQLSGLPAELIYAVMRQETLFRADAQSPANARGLLQLLPETARITARRFNLPVPNADELFEPSTNVPLGAVYLKSLIDGFDGQVLVALAAYNAGPAAVRRWLPATASDAPVESDIWIENIPYNETRAYVQRVLWHSLVFYWLRTNQSLDTQPWLARIRP